MLGVWASGDTSSTELHVSDFRQKRAGVGVPVIVQSCVRVEVAVLGFPS